MPSRPISRLLRLRRGSRRPRTPRARPALERLEDRTLPAAFFPPTAVSGVIEGISAFAVGDFNGDGTPDIALNIRPYAGAPYIDILLGNGDGTFRQGNTYAAGPGSKTLGEIDDIAVADLNGDGKLDLVETNYDDGTVGVYLGNGDGTFAPPRTYAAGRLVRNVTVGDLNGDGKPDLVVVNENDLGVLLNGGDGSFGPLTTVSAPYYADTKPILADFSGDGKLDLAVGVGSAVVVLRGNGDGTFAPYVAYSVPGDFPVLAAADLNGDGKPDLIAETTNSGAALVALLNRGDGTFGSPLVVSQPAGSYLAVGNLDGDGKVDVVTTGGNPYAHASLQLWDGLGNGTFASPLGRDWGVASPVLGDFNRDGKPDILGLVGDPNPYGPFDLHSFAHLAVLSQRTAFPAGVGTFDPGTGTWYLRKSVGPGAPDAGAFPYGGAGWQPVVGDWNGDGTATVGVVDPSSATWYLRNENSPGAPDAGIFPYGLPGWIPVAGDWGGTGHTGIGMFDPATGTWYLRNEAGPGAPDAGVFQYGGPGWIPVVGDWDGNGTTTIGVVDPRTMTWYLRNSNSAGGPDVAPFQYGGVGWKPVVGDWNGGGLTTVGVIDPNGFWYVRYSNAAGGPDVAPFPYGSGIWAPVAGPWLGASGTGPGPRVVSTWELPSTADASLISLDGTGPEGLPPLPPAVPTGAAPEAINAPSTPLARGTLSGPVVRRLGASQASGLDAPFPDPTRAEALDRLFAAQLF
jgi:hypothetical protein